MSILNGFSKTTCTLLLFSLVLVSAQTVNLNHDLDHLYHGDQEPCSIYLAFNANFDSNLYSLELFDSVEEQVFVSSIYSPVFFSPKASFAIRAPPVSLLS